MTKNNKTSNSNADMPYDSVLYPVDYPIDYPVVWEGRQYKGIVKFDCRVVELRYELNGCGGYMTVIPISPKKYREEHQTKAAVTISENAGWTLFSIYSDWGQCYEMNIHNSLTKEIEAARKAAEEQGLLLNGAQQP